MKTYSEKCPITFDVISDELFAVKEAGMKLDFTNDHTHIDYEANGLNPDADQNRADRDVDGFYDLDNASLCKGSDGQLYAVAFNYLTNSGDYSRPYIWQRVVAR